MLQLVFFSTLFGVLCSLCFFPLNVGFLSFVALVPLFKAILDGRDKRGHEKDREGSVWQRLRRGFGRGWLAGAIFFGITFYWIPLLPSENVTVPLIMFPAYLVMTGYLALYMGLFGALLTLVYGRLTRRVVLIAPFLWVVVELLRARGEMGFPWASLGYALCEYPTFIQLASLTSVYGVSFVLVVVNALLYDGLVSRKMRPVLAFSLALCVVAMMGLWGYFSIDGGLRAESRAGSKELRVGLVQGNISSSIKWDPKFRRHNFQVLLDLTREVSQERPDLIIWPETAAPCYLRYEPEYMELLVKTVNSLGIPILVGFPDALPTDNGETYYNSAGLIVPKWGLTQKYDKMHLVPFGERVPYDDVFTFLKRVDFGEADFGRGTLPTVFKLGAEPGEWTRGEVKGSTFGVLICFESIFPELVRSFKVEGAEFLVNITNDEWFGRTVAPYQHAYMAVFRAAETRSSIARCANTGISMLIDPFGRVALEGGLFMREALVGTVRVTQSETFFEKHGFLLLWPLVGIGVIESLVALAISRRTKKAGSR